MGYDIFNTPWGRAQDISHELSGGYTLPDGMVSVSTSSHGGIKVPSGLNKQIPAIFRTESGWYEEDCEYAIALFFFAEQIGLPDDIKTALEDTIKTWYPDQYESHFNVTLKPGESPTKDKQEQIKRSFAENIPLVICARGSWHERCPMGMVYVTARVGGHDAPADQDNDLEFLVPEDEYAQRGNLSFEIDTDRHLQFERSEAA